MLHIGMTPYLADSWDCCKELLVECQSSFVVFFASAPECQGAVPGSPMVHGGGGTYIVIVAYPTFML